MAQALLVQQGTNVVLDENPPQAIASAIQRLKINNLQDLVDIGVIRSRDSLEQLLDAAQVATSSALRLRETYTPMVKVQGTTRPDLRRFGAFRAAAPEVHEADATIFWRVVRGIDPTALAKWHLTTDLSTVGINSRFGGIIKYVFNDVEIQSNAKLTLAAALSSFECGNLTIRTGGQILVQGSAIVIKAFSIQGNVSNLVSQTVTP